MRPILCLLAAGICVSLAACEEPIVRSQEIPAGISTLELVFHRTEWFSCTAAVYRVEPEFARRLQAEGLAMLPSGAGWVATPTPDDMSKETANLTATWQCLAGTQYGDLFQTVADHAGGYYLQTAEGGTDIVIPDQGLLLVGGYE